jgi:alpha-acetolactate decarboxylase
MSKYEYDDKNYYDQLDKMEKISIKEEIGKKSYMYCIYINGIFRYVETININTKMTPELRIKRIMRRILKSKLFF